MKLDMVLVERDAKKIYVEDGQVIKLFDKNYSMADILNEALNQARVGETDLFIPKLLQVTTIEGKCAIINEYIPGKTLEVLMREHPEKEDQYLEQFVDLQMLVHSKRRPC